MKNLKTIAIIGGGFAGLKLAEKLLESNADIKVLLVDKNNYNFFPPLLYQVATGFLDVSNISYPFRKHFRSAKRFSFVMGNLKEIIPEENTIILDCGKIFYTQLIIATGTVTNYFGIESIKNNALPMKTVTDAIQLKNKLLERLEKASKTDDEKQRKKLTTFIIAGGGPTGVEVAGMLSELRKNILFKDYPELKNTSFDIYLVDGLTHILSPMSKKSQQYAQKTLEKSGVKIMLGNNVKEYTDGVVRLADGTSISSENLIWTAGVTAQKFRGLADGFYGKGNRLLVNSFNEVIGTRNIYAIGDTSLMTSDPNFPQGHPQLAQVALQQAKLLAKNILIQKRGKQKKAFIYKDKGSMAIIKRNRAVADLPGVFKHFDGFFAWLIWVFVHLISLINIRNKVTTFFNWLNSYVTKDQPLRMIIDPSKK